MLSLTLMSFGGNLGPAFEKAIKIRIIFINSPTRCKQSIKRPMYG